MQSLRQNVQKAAREFTQVFESIRDRMQNQPLTPRDGKGYLVCTHTHTHTHTHAHTVAIHVLSVCNCASTVCRNTVSDSTLLPPSLLSLPLPPSGPPLPCPLQPRPFPPISPSLLILSPLVLPPLFPVHIHLSCLHLPLPLPRPPTRIRTTRWR